MLLDLVRKLMWFKIYCLEVFLVLRDTRFWVLVFWRPKDYIFFFNKCLIFLNFLLNGSYFTFTLQKWGTKKHLRKEVRFVYMDVCLKQND